MPYLPYSDAAYAGGTHFVQGNPANPVKNNTGCVFYGGTFGLNDPIGRGTSYAPMITMGYGFIGFRSGFSETPNFQGSVAGGTTIGIAGGTFGVVTPKKYILLGFTSQVAGLANTLLNSPANFGMHFSRNAFHSPIRTIKVITTGGWFYQTGQPVNRTAQNDQLNPENNPGSYAIPGDITFLSTGKLAHVQSYISKTD